MSENKLPVDDERYRIPGTDAFNFSKWGRENVPKPPARYKVGDIVVLVIEAEVLRVFEDCDGTPLYQLDRGGNGVSDYDLLPGHEDDWKLDGAIERATAALSRAEQGNKPDRIAALEAALRDVCAAAEYVDPYESDLDMCELCGGCRIEGEFHHAPDCPVAAALALLKTD